MPILSLYNSITPILANLRLSYHGVLIENSLRTTLSDYVSMYTKMSTLPLKCVLDYHPISSSQMF